MPSVALQAEFAGFPESSAAEFDESPFAQYLRLSGEEGGLVPRAMLPAALQLSSQRVSQLVAAGHFNVHRIGTMDFVTGDSLEAFLALERRSGRPVKRLTMGRAVRSVRAALAAK